MTAAVLDEADQLVELRVSAAAVMANGRGERVETLADRGHRARAGRRRVDGAGPKVAFARYGFCSGSRRAIDATKPQVTSGVSPDSHGSGGWVVCPYDPTTGTFLTRDPADSAGPTTQGNPYHYVANDPINNTDPTGMIAADPAFGFRLISFPCPPIAGICLWPCRDKDPDGDGVDDDGFCSEEQNMDPGGRCRIRFFSEFETDDGEFGTCWHYGAPTVCHRVGGASGRATADSRRLYPGSQHNGVGDAFRHTYWAALSASKVGFQVALDVLHAHENQVPGPSEEYFMDMWNNLLGSRIGSRMQGSSEDGILAAVVVRVRIAETIAWTGVVNDELPQLSIGIQHAADVRRYFPTP